MSVGQKIKAMRKAKRMTQKDLAEKLDLVPTSISAWERGAAKPMMDSLSKMAKLFDVSIEYFYGYDSKDQPMYIRETQEDFDLARNIRTVAPASVRIPILGSISCGDPLLAVENIKGYRNESPDLLPAGELYYLEANGNSMEPVIPNGSLVLIRHQPEVESGEIAAVLLNGDEDATLKRVRIQNDRMILYPENKEYDPIFVDEDHPVKIIGKAVEVKFRL
ncbi:helix-turn-helix domain-containing protein [Sporosarcina trichiuri]|uniref:helix-turn-helix domain-containing protein n=1 Tax=Sporosarcina trichiuri TaxID=3056445 RepID=UPI0025B33B2E|nr:XRE family transcriptional regulator [Sporosarcina sp. 0.2-SM1T-5]WJY27417.1 XRE family transcriptional regulator [Sporosarcina sp. 0.2-SM1T-5]